MLLNLHTNRVAGYTGGQAALTYLVVSVEEVGVRRVAGGLGGGLMV